MVLLLTAEDVPEDCDYVVDGTLFPCLDWRRRRDLWSVKHRRAGMNVQILVRLDGGFVWTSDPYPGSMWITTGPRTKELEKKIAHQLGTPKSVCLNSATAALDVW